jgi:hypothetical protein
MRHLLGQLANVLEQNEGDEPMDAVVRRFWSRTTASPRMRVDARGVVVDLAHWSKTRDELAEADRRHRGGSQS